MDLVNMVYEYINKFIDSKELLKKLENMDLSDYPENEKKLIEKLIVDLNKIIETTPNEVDDSETNIQEMGKVFISEIENALATEDLDDEEKEFLTKQLEEVIAEVNKVRDGGKLYDNVADLVSNHELFNEYFDSMNIEELLEFITSYTYVPLPPVLAQDGFDALVNEGVDKDKREALYRLASNYSGRDIDFARIVDYFIDKRDVSYLVELISIIIEDISMPELFKKVISTGDKEFITNCATKAVEMGYLTDEDILKIVISSYDYEGFKEDLTNRVSNEENAEYLFVLNNELYNIIGTENSVVFQKLDFDDETVIEEEVFNDIDELYNTQTLDGVLLNRDWDNIENPDYF